MQNLMEATAWVIGGGGAGILAYALLETMPFQGDLTPKGKRFLAGVLCCVIGILVYLFTVYMGWEPTCGGDARCWIEGCANTALVAFATSQAIHGTRDLPA